MAEGDDGDKAPASFKFRWDVFLSFSGEDTRHGFTARLKRELVSSGLRTFMDDEGLDQGDEIAPSLLEAIHDSATAVAVISPNYATSRWCLEELATIVRGGRLLLPVFYQVDPSDVRRQRGPFQEAFRSLELRFDQEMVGRWRRAMEKAGGISGWDSRTWEEQQIIRSSIKRLSKEISNIPLRLAKFSVGLNPRLEQLMSELDIEAGGVRVLGLHGMGGIGKTTLAKAVYNKLSSYFTSCAFISNIKETWKQDSGAIDLQRQLIFGISSSTAPPVLSVSEGILTIRQLVYESPVLIVLDDVDNDAQLVALAVNKDWFFQGSRIIITTRDKNVLEGKVNQVYEVKVLASKEALELFNCHAFGRDQSPKDFVGLSSQIVSLTGGLPLALEVFGSFLADKRKMKDWESALQKLKQIRPHDLQDVLEISFNDLDEQVKCIFLDIACFFVQMNMNKEDAIDIFNGCGFSAENAITVLTVKSLLKITDSNLLWMHDQLRDMGRQIVYREYQGDPGSRSRLWDRDDVLTVLRKEMGTRNIQGIVLDVGKNNNVRSEKISWKNFIRKDILHQQGFSCRVEKENNVMLSVRSFKPLLGLRLLQINGVKLHGNFEPIAAGLKWLQWKGLPLMSLPRGFCPQDLAVLDLSESKIRHVWDARWCDWLRNKAFECLVQCNILDAQMPEKLKVLNLHDCLYLENIPDLSRHQVLEKLNLERCKGLVKIHKSVGDLNSLLYLNLKDCSNLVQLPSDVSGLKRLETLILSGCSMLKELPEGMGCMKSLIKLFVDETGIVSLPDSIFRLKKLEMISLNSCHSLKSLPAHIGKLSSLTELSLRDAGLEALPDSVEKLTNLETLDLRRCRSLTALPSSVGNLKSLENLFLDYSPIKELPDSIGLLSHLNDFSISACRDLSKLPDSIGGLTSLVKFQLEQTQITEVPDEIFSLSMLENLQMGNCKLLRSLPEFAGNMLSITTLVLDHAIITELPESIEMLGKLQVLILDNCVQLRKLPASIGKLKRLQRLSMKETAVTELPEDFGQLSNLTFLKMSQEQHLDQPQNTRGCMPIVLPISFSNLSSLKELDASSWKLSGKIPDNFERLSSLETLNLTHNNFCSLPSSLSGLGILKKLALSKCMELKSIPPLPSSLVELNAANCFSLESISDLSKLGNLWLLDLTNCTKIIDIPGLQCLKSLRRLYLGCCNACFPAVKERLAKAAFKYLQYLSVPASEIPSWFVQVIPSFSCPRNRDIKGVIIAVVVSLDPMIEDNIRGKLPALVDVHARIIRNDDAIFTTTLYLLGVPETIADQLYLCRFMEFDKFVLMLKDGDRIEVGLRSPPRFKGLTLKKHGIHLVFENDDDTDDDEDSLSEHQHSVSKKLATFFNSL